MLIRRLLTFSRWIKVPISVKPVKNSLLSAAKVEPKYTGSINPIIPSDTGSLEEVKLDWILPRDEKDTSSGSLYQIVANDPKYSGSANLILPSDMGSHVSPNPILSSDKVSLEEEKINWILPKDEKDTSSGSDWLMPFLTIGAGAVVVGDSSDEEDGKPGRLFNERDNASIIAVGNPGVGKSTILNSLADEFFFKSGTSFGGGLTYQLDERSNKNGRRFFDTPGLADRKLREKAGQAITQALKKGGEYKILFFLRTESGRAVAEDITTLKLVLDSAPEIGDQYGIVINKVSPKLSKKLMDKEHPENAMDFLTEIFANIDPKRQCRMTSITFLPIIHDVDEENDKLIPVNDLKTIDGIPFKNYVTKYLISAKLTQCKANNIAIHDFEKQTEEIETLKHELKQNKKMFEKKQKEMEQEWIRKEQQAQQALDKKLEENQRMFEKKQKEMKQEWISEKQQAEQALEKNLREIERMFEMKQKEMEQEQAREQANLQAQFAQQQAQERERQQAQVAQQQEQERELANQAAQFEEQQAKERERANQQAQENQRIFEQKQKEKEEEHEMKRNRQHEEEKPKKVSGKESGK